MGKGFEDVDDEIVRQELEEKVYINNRTSLAWSSAEKKTMWFRNLDEMVHTEQPVPMVVPISNQLSRKLHCIAPSRASSMGQDPDQAPILALDGIRAAIQNLSPIPNRPLISTDQ